MPFAVEEAEEPDDPPGVTIADGVTSLALEVGETRTLSLLIDDEEPATVSIEATLEPNGVAGLGGANTTEIDITGVTAGNAMLDIVVTDTGGQSADVEVDVSLAQMAPRRARDRRRARCSTLLADTTFVTRVARASFRHERANDSRLTAHRVRVAE